MNKMTKADVLRLLAAGEITTTDASQCLVAIQAESEAANIAEGHLTIIRTPSEGTTPESRAAKAIKVLGYSFGDLIANVRRALLEGDLPFLREFNEAMGDEKTPPAATAVPDLRELTEAMHKARQARLLAKEAERPKPAAPQEKQDNAFPSWLPGAAVVVLIVLGVWWFNYSDHAQQVRDDGLIKIGTACANAMHVAPPRTPEEARLIMLQRAAQLDRYIEKKYGPDAQQNADRERDDFDRDRQNDSYRE
jgi:hypothetical protein